MNESQTISKQLPALSSMQYETLRELGIQRIQELAGRLWTDYNTHDPGITMLEVLSYVLTDIGYRVNYDIKDLLALPPGSTEDIQNFYTAAEILPVCPVTLNDFRELLIDIEIPDDPDAPTEYFGVKNAWLLKADDAELPIYVDHVNSLLSLDPVPDVSVQDSFFVKTLYNVLLEFTDSETYGDLNENTIEADFVLYDFPALPTLQGLRLGVTITFPAWDANLDWTDSLAVRNAVSSVHISVKEIADGYGLDYQVAPTGQVILSPTADSDPIPDMAGLNTLLNDFLYDSITGLIVAYREKVAVIHNLVAEVKAQLHAHRNLCDDFYKINALKVEKILLCADIELDNRADVEATEAAIFHAISEFLSPTVYFYTLEEMLNKCAIENTYTIHELDTGNGRITIQSPLKEDVGSEDTVSIQGDEVLAGEYTVVCVKQNKENPNYTDIQVVETIESEVVSEDTIFFVGKIDENLCKTVDEVFEGPLHKHGFIDEAELEAAQLTKNIHVSDLIRIIMDIEGVTAVRSIQIANKPQNNVDGIAEKSVKWCLDLAWEHNYVPRLCLDGSKLTYYKEQLPFLADSHEVDTLVEELQSQERPQRIRYPKMDIDAPLGKYRSLDAYVSLQEEFPDIYGVGTPGIPELSSLEGLNKAKREGQVKQLKGFLTFFDQLVANELAQLHHVKDLFSMNGEKNEFGEYQIDQTYFSRSLSQVIPNGTDLYVDEAGHLVSLQQIVEDETVYIERRNRFLDHLLGRFAETFTDYALLVYKMDGQKAGLDLIEDKLQFLARYPELSSERGKGFNYLQPCYQWHINNVSGVEQRVSFLTGIEERGRADLRFSENFVIQTTGGFSINDDGLNSLMIHAEPLEDELAVKERFEDIIMTGICRDYYEIIPQDGGVFSFQLYCDGRILGVSALSNYTSDTPGGDAEMAILDLMEILEREYFENHESNRKNLSCPYNNYFNYSLSADISPAPPELPTFTLDYELYSEAFRFTNAFRVLRGSITEKVTLEETETLPLTESQVLRKAESRLRGLLWEIISSATDRRQFLLDAGMNPYRFQLCSSKGVVLGHSIRKDFNAPLAQRIDNSAFDQLEIQSSTANDGTYIITAANASGPNIDLVLDQNLPSPIFDGEAKWAEHFDIELIDTENRIIKASTNISNRYKVGDNLEVTGSTSNDGFYTIRKIKNSGGKTSLYCTEPIPAELADGSIVNRYEFQIVGISGNTITLLGGEDEKAIQEFMAYIRKTFFSHEGMHLLEHILIRPRIHQDLFVPLSPERLEPLGGTSAELIFPKRTDILSANTATNTIRVATNIKAEIESDTIHIEGGPYHGQSFELEKITTQSGRSVLHITTPLPFSLPQPPFENGVVRYQTVTVVGEIIPITNTVVVGDEATSELMADDQVQLINPDLPDNEGIYTVAEVTVSGTDREVHMSAKEELVSDGLLTIHLDDDCEACQKKDVYSCIATVVLPYWAGRFINLDFRKFMEKTLRLETPAHVLLNICWIDCEHMENFETAYKRWLLEINKPVWDGPRLSAAQRGLIEALEASRNVYPPGTLHSCDDDESLEGAIILNNSVLGT